VTKLGRDHERTLSDSFEVIRLLQHERLAGDLEILDR
jgi:hypothetical protein